jgi:hypothetical protein
MDGFLVETTGQCKKGMDIAYDGTWGYCHLPGSPLDLPDSYCGLDAHVMVFVLEQLFQCRDCLLGVGAKAPNRLSDIATKVCGAGQSFNECLESGKTQFAQQVGCGVCRAFIVGQFLNECRDNRWWMRIRPLQQVGEVAGDQAGNVTIVHVIEALRNLLFDRR